MIDNKKLLQPASYYYVNDGRFTRVQLGPNKKAECRRCNPNLFPRVRQRVLQQHVRCTRLYGGCVPFLWTIRHKAGVSPSYRGAAVAVDMLGSDDRASCGNGSQQMFWLTRRLMGHRSRRTSVCCGGPVYGAAFKCCVQIPSDRRCCSCDKTAFVEMNAQGCHPQSNHVQRMGWHGLERG